MSPEPKKKTRRRHKQGDVQKVQDVFRRYWTDPRRAQKFDKAMGQVMEAILRYNEAHSSQEAARRQRADEWKQLHIVATDLMSRLKSQRHRELIEEMELSALAKGWQKEDPQRYARSARSFYASQGERPTLTLHADLTRDIRTLLKYLKADDPRKGLGTQGQADNSLLGDLVHDLDRAFDSLSQRSVWPKEGPTKDEFCSEVLTKTGIVKPGSTTLRDARAASRRRRR